LPGQRSITRWVVNEERDMNVGKAVLMNLAAAAAVVALAGCGGGSGAVTAAVAPSTSTDVAGTSASSGSSTGVAGTSPASGSSTAGGAVDSAAREAYRSCLADHGVTLPQRTPGQGGPPSTAAGATRSTIDPTVMQAAQTACASLRPAGQGGGFGQGGAGQGGAANSQFRQAYQAYLSCLADHGVTVPSTAATTATVPSTPTAGAGAPGGGRPGGFNRPSFDQNDPTFQAANQVCGVLLPARPGTDGSTTTTAG
jgi:hypothetical protein